MSNLTEFFWIVWTSIAAYAVHLQLLGGEAIIAAGYLAIIISLPVSLVFLGIFVATCSFLEWVGWFGGVVPDWLGFAFVPVILVLGGLQWFCAQKYRRQQNHRVTEFERQLAELAKRRISTTATNMAETSEPPAPRVYER
jgi:hypothetical protein